MKTGLYVGKSASFFAFPYYHQVKFIDGELEKKHTKKAQEA